MRLSTARTAPLLRLGLLFLLLFIFTSVALAIQLAWLGPSLSLQVPLAPSVRWMQLITTIFTFLFPALGWAILAHRTAPNPLGFSLPKRQSWLLFGLAVGVLMAIPNALLSEINASLPMPEWAISMDKKVEAASRALLAVNSLQGYLTNILIIAIAPAVCEEFFFRGALQHDLLRLIKNTHSAIWIGALIFSLIHFQLSGLIPRLVLGAALGYLAYYSHSLWPAVAMHFTNNFLAVTLSAIAYRQGDIARYDHITPWIAWPATLLSLAIIIYIFARAEKRKQAKSPEPNTLN